ncbi:MAG TPA: hypothetical protein VFF24_05390 [Acidimicrobiia bacterium]|jgi:hypothetical protein|nr:hypothetical protein [Acidimicrobiia bacterium]
MNGGQRGITGFAETGWPGRTKHRGQEGVDDVRDDGPIGGQAPVEQWVEQPGDGPVEVEVSAAGARSTPWWKMTRTTLDPS